MNQNESYTTTKLPQNTPQNHYTHQKESETETIKKKKQKINITVKKRK